MGKLATTVPFCVEKAFGSTETVITAGVTPLEGETERPGVLEEIVNGVFPPPGSVIVIVCRVVERLQKFPRKTRSSTEAVKRGVELRLPTGSTVTPLSEIAYTVLWSFVMTLLPARFSGSTSWSCRVRLSASRI